MSEYLSSLQTRETRADPLSSTTPSVEQQRAGDYLGEDREGREYWQVGSGVRVDLQSSLRPCPPSRVWPFSSPNRHRSRTAAGQTRRHPQTRRSQNP